jgi:hypothetical protein
VPRVELPDQRKAAAKSHCATFASLCTSRNTRNFFLVDNIHPSEHGRTTQNRVTMARELR